MTYETIETLLDTSYPGSGQSGKGYMDSPKIDYFDDTKSASRSIFQIKFYRELSIARNFDDFSERIKRILTDLGFEQFSFVRLAATDPMPNRLITMPHEMSEIYFNEEFYEHDLSLQYAVNDNDPIFHSTIEDYINRAPFVSDTIKQNREIFKLLRSYCYVDFYLIPMGAANGNGRVLLGVATKDESIDNFRTHIGKCKDILDLLAEAIDYFGTRKFPEFFLGKDENREIIITPKPLILLKTLAQEDLTLAQAADSLCISVHTANKHIAAARLALGAQTIHGAVYKAIKAGLVDGY